MKVVLELQDQPSNVRRITVRHDIVIGRGSDCNLRLSAPQVSRRHCFLRVGRDSVSVTDLDSSNGTFIDGTRITSGKRYDIANGAQLALGPIRFIIHVRSEVAETATSGSKPESKRPKSKRDALAGFVSDDSNTISAKLQAGDAKPPMDYAVEHAGESAEPHEPTADYLDEQFSANSSVNLFSNTPDPADSRVGTADFSKRPGEQLERNQESNDFPDADIFGESAIAHQEPQWDSNVADSSGSAENLAAPNDDGLENSWLSVDDDSIFPEPMNLGNAYVGDASHDAFNDADAALVDAEVIEDVEEIEEVLEVHEFDEVSEVAEADDIIDAETNLEEIEEVMEVHDLIEVVDAAQAEPTLDAEQTVNDAEPVVVEDWLNFDEVVEVQETLDVEDVIEVEDEIEVEDALDEVAVSEIQDASIVEDVAELQNEHASEEITVIEEASADAEDMQVQDWLNFDEAVEVHDSADVEVVEQTLNEVVVSEIQDASIVEDVAELQSKHANKEVAVIEEASADANDVQVQDWLIFDNAVEVHESVDVEDVIEVEDEIEVEDALDEVVVSEIHNASIVDDVAELQSEHASEEVAVAEEATADAKDMDVQDWLNFDDAVEPHDCVEVVEVEQPLNEVVIHETGSDLHVEAAIEPEADIEELAEVEYLPDGDAVMEAEDVHEFDNVEEIQESMEFHAPAAEPSAVDDALEIAVEEDGESDWFKDDEVSESDTFFDNFEIPELKTDHTDSAETAEKDNDIDPDLQNFLKGF